MIRLIKVIIADDQVILRESLKFIIEQDNEIQVAGCAGNGNEAFNMCGKLLPDVVLMDIQMPVCDGIEGTRLIKENFNSIKVVMLTTFDDDEKISKALDYGADGYMLKDIKPDELIIAVKSAAKGISVIHKSAMATIKNRTKTTPNTKTKERKIDINLTEREISIVKLIVEGQNNKEIALELFLTEGTIKNIVSGILTKLNLKDRTQLAVFAVKNHIL